LRSRAAGRCLRFRICNEFATTGKRAREQPHRLAALRFEHVPVGVRGDLDRGVAHQRAHGLDARAVGDQHARKSVAQSVEAD
jgi:hypothetical protein